MNNIVKSAVKFCPLCRGVTTQQIYKTYCVCESCQGTTYVEIKKEKSKRKKIANGNM